MEKKDWLNWALILAVSVQAAAAVSNVVTNKNHIAALQESTQETRNWLITLQQEVTELRVKVGK